jgi:hypothetical protein
LLHSNQRIEQHGGQRKTKEIRSQTSHVGVCDLCGQIRYNLTSGIGWREALADAIVWSLPDQRSGELTLQLLMCEVAMKLIRFLLLIAAIACLVVFFSFSYQRKITNGSETTELRIGFQPSPWAVWVSREGASSSSVNLLSWSTVFLLASVGCSFGYSRIGSAEKTSQSKR